MKGPITEQEFLKSRIQREHRQKIDELPENVKQAVLAQLYISNNLELTPEEKEVHRQYPIEVKKFLGHYTFNNKKPVKRPTRDEIIKMGAQTLGEQSFFRELGQNISGETYKNDDYFLKLTRGVIRDDLYRQVFVAKGRSVIYEYLWANIVRNGWKDKPGYPLKERYYDEGLLVHSSSYRKVGEKCFLDKDTVKTILKDEFHPLGIIRLIFMESKGNRNGQFVAILGNWQMEYNHQKQKDVPVETYFRDELFYLNNSGKTTIH